MLPQPHVVAVGRSPAVKTPTNLASALDWRVTVVVDGGNAGDHSAGYEVVTTLAMPEGIDSATSIVIATQGHYDEPALEAALATEAGYIGLVASAKRAETVLGYLRDRGVAPEQLERITAPARIDLGHIQHREIGLAVFSELVALRAKGAVGEGSDTAEPANVPIDPVCHMEVEVATAGWITEYAGYTYYFCASGCNPALRRIRRLFLPAKPLRLCL